MQSLSILIFPKVFFSPLSATSPRAHYLKKLSPLALLPVFLPWLLGRAPTVFSREWDERVST
jgi:hypothetical protein